MSKADYDSLKLAEIAARINEHLVRSYTAGNPLGLWAPSGPKSCFAGYHGGNVVTLRYVSYQAHPKLSRAEALAYLAALDAGYVGRHFFCPVVKELREARLSAERAAAKQATYDRRRKMSAALALVRRQGNVSVRKKENDDVEE